VSFALPAVAKQQQDWPEPVEVTDEELATAE
jgi:hypothetical protein